MFSQLASKPAANLFDKISSYSVMKRISGFFGHVMCGILNISCYWGIAFQYCHSTSANMDVHNYIFISHRDWPSFMTIKIICLCNQNQIYESCFKAVLKSVRYSIIASIIKIQEMCTYRMFCLKMLSISIIFKTLILLTFCKVLIIDSRGWTHLVIHTHWVGMRNGAVSHFDLCSRLTR